MPGLLPGPQAKCAECDDTEHVQCQTEKVDEEVLVIASANTVVHPWTMMIKSLQRKRIMGK